jgi:hypothetical protein
VPTTITNSIGATGRDYATIALWEAAMTANMVAADEAWVGECYNDGEFSVAGTVVTIDGHTTDATRTITLKCATGQSFRDNGSVQSNALRYNQSNGVGIKCTSSYGQAITVSDANVYLHGLQVSCTAANSNAIGTGSEHATIDYCLLTSNPNSGGGIVKGAGSILRNSVLYKIGSATGHAIDYSIPTGDLTVNCTFVEPSDLSGATAAVKTTTTKIILKNCAIFGFALSETGTGGIHASSSYNSTDLASLPGSNNLTSQTFADQFEATPVATLDLRVKAGAGLIDAGVTDATHAATDIAGTARPEGGAYDIGAWEYVSGGGGGSNHNGLSLLGVG